MSRPGPWSAWTAWTELSGRQVSPVPFAVFRIAFCSIVVAEIVQLIEFQELLFHPASSHGQQLLTTSLLWTWLVAAAAAAVGWRTRAATLVTYALAVYFLGFQAPAKGFDYHHDALILPALAILALLPAGRALSVDDWIARSRSSAAEGSGARPRAGGSITVWSRALPLLVLGAMYADSVVAKLGSTLWRRGLGVWVPATFPFATTWDVSPFLERRSLMIISGYVALCFEATFLLALLSARLRPLYLWVGMALHAGIALLYPIPLFGLGAMAYLSLLVPASGYARIGAAFRGTLRRRESEARGDDGSDRGRPRLAWPWAPAAIAAALVAWAIVVGFIALRASPAGDTEVYRTLRPRLNWLYAFTGISEHALFVDRHFQGYDRQLSLWERRDGSMSPLPYITESGEAGPWMRGRVWTLWSWHVVRPTMSAARQRDGLARFASFWAWRTGRAAAAEVVVRERPLEVSIGAWRAGLARRNRERPWRDLGRLTIHNESDSDRAPSTAREAHGSS
jgi:hypothetical protein